MHLHQFSFRCLFSVLAEDLQTFLKHVLRCVYSLLPNNFVPEMMNVPGYYFASISAILRRSLTKDVINTKIVNFLLLFQCLQV